MNLNPRNLKVWGLPAPASFDSFQAVLPNLMSLDFPLWILKPAQRSLSSRTVMNRSACSLCSKPMIKSSAYLTIKEKPSVCLYHWRQAKKNLSRTWCRKIFASSGLMTAPCVTPVLCMYKLLSSSTPDLSIPLISLRILLSEILSFRTLIKISWLMLSKHPTISAFRIYIIHKILFYSNRQSVKAVVCPSLWPKEVWESSKMHVKDGLKDEL